MLTGCRQRTFYLVQAREYGGNALRDINGKLLFTSGHGAKTNALIAKVLQDQAVANFNNKTSILSSAAKFEEYQPTDVEILKKTTTVDRDFGRRLQKAPSLSGNSTCSWKL